MVLVFLALLAACISSISPDRFLFTVQQLIRYGNVADIGRSRRHTMDHVKGLIDSDVHLDTKVPLVSLPGLIHLRGARFFAVPGRARGGDDRRIHDGAFLEHQTFISQVLVDGIEDDLTQATLLKEVPEVQDSGLVGNPLRDPKAGKPPHGFQLIECVFHGCVPENSYAGFCASCRQTRPRQMSSVSC